MRHVYGWGWVSLLLFRESCFQERAHFFGVDFDRTRKRGMYRETGSTNNRNTTQGEERRGGGQSKKRSFEGVG